MMTEKTAKAEATKQGNANGYRFQNFVRKSGKLRSGCASSPPSGRPIIWPVLYATLARNQTGVQVNGMAKLTVMN